MQRTTYDGGYGLRSLSEDREVMVGNVAPSNSLGPRLDPVMEMMSQGRTSFDEASAQQGERQIRGFRANLCPTRLDSATPASSLSELVRATQNLSLNLGLGLGGMQQANRAAAAAAASSLAAAAAASNVMAFQSMQHQAKVQQDSLAAGMGGMGLHSPMNQLVGMQGLTDDMSILNNGEHNGLNKLACCAFYLSSVPRRPCSHTLFLSSHSLLVLNKAVHLSNHSPMAPEMNVAVQQLMAAAAVHSQGRRSLDAATAHIKRMENNARVLENSNSNIVSARCGVLREEGCPWTDLSNPCDCTCPGPEPSRHPPVQSGPSHLHREVD